MSDLPQPAYVKDNPIMAGAFASFMEWIWGQDEAHAAFTAATGHHRPSPPKNGLEAAIDRATGADARAKQYVSAFAAWAIREHWGEEGDPRMDEALATP